MHYTYVNYVITYGKYQQQVQLLDINIFPDTGKKRKPVSFAKRDITSHTRKDNNEKQTRR